MTAFSMAHQSARDALLRAALRVVAADYFADDANPHAGAESEYAGEKLALAARELVRAVDALPEDQQPIGWVEQSKADSKDDAARCSCYRSPFDHEYECPRAVVTQGGVDYPIGKQYLDRDGTRWSFWGENTTGEPMVKLFPFSDADEPDLLSTVVAECGPFTAVDSLPDEGLF